MLIPKRAVLYEGGERYVFTVVNNRAVKKKLKAGFEDPNNFEAVSGFEVGTPVIVLGQSGLKDGALVRSVNATPSALPVIIPPKPAGDVASPSPKATVPPSPSKSDKS